jgi:hypothetical protein
LALFDTLAVPEAVEVRQFMDKLDIVAEGSG